MPRGGKPSSPPVDGRELTVRGWFDVQSLRHIPIAGREEADCFFADPVRGCGAYVFVNPNTGTRWADLRKMFARAAAGYGEGRRHTRELWTSPTLSVNDAAMSIKRTREPPRRRAPESDRSRPATKTPERAYAWDVDVAVHPPEAFVAYGPAHRYAQDSLLVHPVFGKGLVTRVDGARIEVLFQAGPKKLVHNPAGSSPPAVPATNPETPPGDPPAST